MSRVVLVVVCVLAFCSEAIGQVRIAFGNLHAHSQLSDGNQTITPTEACRMAREEGTMNFLCLSEHNHTITQAAMDALVVAADAATSSCSEVLPSSWVDCA